MEQDINLILANRNLLQGPSAAKGASFSPKYNRGFSLLAPPLNPVQLLFTGFGLCRLLLKLWSHSLVGSHENHGNASGGSPGQCLTHLMLSSSLPFTPSTATYQITCLRAYHRAGILNVSAYYSFWDGCVIFLFSQWSICWAVLSYMILQVLKMTFMDDRVLSFLFQN